MAEGNRDKNPKTGSSQFIAELLSEYLKADEGTQKSAKDPKTGSAEAVTELLGRYLTDEEFRAVRERVQQAAGERIRSIRNRYRRRDPGTAARERDLSLRLAEVEAEAAELRLRLAELLEEEGRLRSDLDAL